MLDIVVNNSTKKTNDGISSSFSTIYQRLANDRPHWANEEEVRKSWLKHLENELDITFHVNRGRNDASYNQIIIEFKNKGLFRGNTSSPAFKEAIFERLSKYISRRSNDEGNL